MNLADQINEDFTLDEKSVEHLKSIITRIEAGEEFSLFIQAQNECGETMSSLMRQGDTNFVLNIFDGLFKDLPDAIIALLDYDLGEGDDE